MIPSDVPSCVHAVLNTQNQLVFSCDYCPEVITLESGIFASARNLFRIRYWANKLRDTHQNCIHKEQTGIIALCPVIQDLLPLTVTLVSEDTKESSA